MNDEPQKTPQTSEKPASSTPKAAPANKPVVVYIMILFIAAFLLMALSFLMHQRSNTEALGQLQNSVTAIQEVQATQEENIALQEQLREVQETLDDTVTAYDNQLKALVGDLEQKQLELDALTQLYVLQAWYSAENYAACQELIDTMEEEGLVEALPTDPYSYDNDTVTAPSLCFQQLKEAVQEHLAP